MTKQLSALEERVKRIENTLDPIAKALWYLGKTLNEVKLELLREDVSQGVTFKKKPTKKRGKAK